jgi:hypothetical protein
MKSYAEFIKHYNYKDNAESKKLYAEYKKNYAIFESMK